MSIRLNLLVALSLSILNLTAMSAAAQNTSAPKRAPNVVLLLADDLGSKDIGCYGGPVKTPVLDSLAQKGVKFTNFYSAAPVCSTARASLLTGRHHLRTGVYTVIQDHIHRMHLLKSETTIAEILQTNGYATAHVGKWHLGTPFRGMKKPWIDEHGFDYWFATDLNAAPSHKDPVNFWRNRQRVGPLKGYACQLVVDEAIGWLNSKRDQQKPFFLNVWFHEPHAPLAAPADIVAEYGQPSDQAAVYSATIDNTDRAIGRLIQHLEKTGQLNNTIIIYTSDHGSYRPERNGKLRGRKGSLLEGGTRTPGIVYWKKLTNNSHVENTPASALDILPTICGLTGAAVPANLRLDGTDLSPLLTGDPASQFKRQQPLTWHSPASQPTVVMRDGQYSLVGYRRNEYPKNQEAIRAAMSAMRVILEKQEGRKLTRNELWHSCYNSQINTPDWNTLRSKFVALNTFQEAWIPLIKSGSGGFSKFELYDLSQDAGQTKNIANRFPVIARRMQDKLQAINNDVLLEAPSWGSQVADESSLRVHRLNSAKRSVFDAFVYVNRIPVVPKADESQTDLTGRILGRLANQEGRVLIKLPPGMDRAAYNGFRFALDYDVQTATKNANGQPQFGTCFDCHTLPDLGNGTSKPTIPTLRNLELPARRLRELIRNETHQHIRVDDNAINSLSQFLKILSDVPDSNFRNLILNATVLDTSGEPK